MKQPHKHAALIKAWADGANIEVQNIDDKRWYLVFDPRWHKQSEYRIKPEPTPDVVRYAEAKPTLFSMCDIGEGCEKDNIKLTFDGETLKLKAVEMIGGK